MSIPVISIVIPTYNHREALPRCLASIAAQTFQDFEVIIVDDGSTDGTAEAVRNFQFPIPNSQFLRFEKNRGAPAARNTGLRAAKGEYILFCDADVVMRPDMLKRMMQALREHPDASYAYCSFKFGWKTFTLFPFDANRLRRMPYIHSTSLIRRTHIPKNGWDESLIKLQDWDFFLTVLEEGHGGIWIPEVLFTVEPRRIGYSAWIPAFAYRLMPWLPTVQKYRAAEIIVKMKHRLV
ncbi:glycosyltransferase family 2 protein [Candidatus Uhrbacteria bacterium]|nr:glycosyltransferase family 2 protein [Candidatus Uhrbacteria bacterium]